MGYKYKLNEMSKKASAEDAEKELGIPKSKFEVGQVTVSDDGTSQSTITNIDPDTGAISWRIKQLPGFEKLYDEVDDFVDVAKRVYQKTKEDKKFREFYEQARKIRNSIRTHLRNEYPDQYKRIVNISEINENEEPSNKVEDAALILPRGKEVILQAEEQDYKRGLLVELTNKGGYKIKYWYGDDVKVYPAEVEVDGESIKKDAIEVDILFHPELEEGHHEDKDVEEISMSGGAGAYQTPYAFRLPKKKKKKKVNEVKENPGATLGPGPAAGEDGVSDNAYVKQFKYQLVPKNKDGTYVQKGSGLEVKKLY